MVEQISSLTEERVINAEKRIGFSHPVLDVINQHIPELTELNENVASLKSQKDQTSYIEEHYGFLADSLVKAGPYTLNPEDIIAIWSRAKEVFSTVYQKYALARMISYAYVIQGLNIADWKVFPRLFFEKGEFPEPFEHDSAALIHIKKKLGEIDGSLRDIHLFLDSSGYSISDLISLEFQSEKGDTDAKKKLEEIKSQRAKVIREDPLLEEIGENFGNALVPLRLSV